MYVIHASARAGIQELMDEAAVFQLAKMHVSTGFKRLSLDDCLRGHFKRVSGTAILVPLGAICFKSVLTSPPLLICAGS